MKNPICFALDFPNLGNAVDFIADNRLYSELGAVKVGLELFTASGPRAVRIIDDTFALPVVLDLKLHDIPETVARTVKVGGDMGVKFMTLHVQQRKTLEQAVKAAEPFGITLLGVTVLTSMEQSDLDDLGLKGARPGARAALLTEFGYTCGLRGFVCSPQEVGGLRATTPKDAFFLVPGIRPADTAAGDQKRTGTPGQAVADGANLIVVGRPIRDAADPRQAVQDMLKEINESTK